MGTQFGIIIYGYKHFGDPEVVAANPVPELTSLYRKVNALIEFRKSVKRLPELLNTLKATQEVFAELQSNQPDPEGRQGVQETPKVVGICRTKGEVH